MSGALQGTVLMAGASQALDWVAPAGDAALAVLVGAGFSTVTLAFMSPFGACVTRHPAEGALPRGDGEAFAASVVAEARSRGRAVAAACEDPADAGANGPAGGWDAERALADFRARAPEVPVRLDGAGRERVTTWSVAPLGTVPFERGDRLSLEAAPCPGGTVVRWRGSGGRDAGVHVVLAREADEAERGVAEGVEGTVVCAVHGEMPGPGGRRVVQTLVIDAPAAVLRSFRDGRWPRHGVVRE